MGRLRTKAAVEDVAGAGIVIPRSISGRPVQRSWSRDEIAKVAMTSCETAANCIVFRGDGVGKAPFGRIVDGQIDETHPISQRFKYPNGQYSQSDFLHQIMYCLQSDEDGAFIVCPLDNKGQPMAMWVRSGKYVRPVPDEDVFIRGYQLFRDGQWFDADPDTTLIWQHRFVPMQVDNLFGSWPPLVRAARAVRSFQFLGRWIEELLKNRAIIDGFITNRDGENMDPNTARDVDARVQEDFNGPSQGGGFRFLPGNLDFVELGMKLSDVNPGEMEDRLETKICGSFQLNPVSVRTHAGNTLAGGLGGDKVEQLIRQDYQGTITSDWTLLAGDFGTALAERYGLDPSEVGFDVSGIRELDEGIDEKYARMKGAWFMSPNKALAIVGEDPSDDPMADLPLAVLQAKARATAPAATGGKVRPPLA